MYHSITIGDKNTWDDWHLIPATRPLFNPPLVKFNLQDVPGGDGMINLTKALAGRPTYGNRTGSWTFYVENGFKDWTALYRCNKNKPAHYVVFATHRAKVLKSFASCDQLDGFDVFLYGHDHDSIDHPRGKLVYNVVSKTIDFRPIEMLNCGSFLKWTGGYAPRGSFRPGANKFFKLILSAGPEKDIRTLGFYPKEKQKDVV